jgi:hypothetical protein
MSSASITRTIAAWVVRQGRTDTDAVFRAFPHLPRTVVQRAIKNAYGRGLIHVEKRGRGGWSSEPAIFCAPLPDMEKAQGQRVRVASVWDLADPNPLPILDLPGRVFAPLGPWSELEGAAAA